MSTIVAREYPSNRRMTTRRRARKDFHVAPRLSARQNGGLGKRTPTKPGTGGIEKAPSDAPPPFGLSVFPYCGLGGGGGRLEQAGVLVFNLTFASGGLA